MTEAMTEAMTEDDEFPPSQGIFMGIFMGILNDEESVLPSCARTVVQDLTVPL